MPCSFSDMPPRLHPGFPGRAQNSTLANAPQYHARPGRATAVFFKGGLDGRSRGPPGGARTSRPDRRGRGPVAPAGRTGRTTESRARPDRAPPRGAPTARPPALGALRPAEVRTGAGVPRPIVLRTVWRAGGSDLRARAEALVDVVVQGDERRLVLRGPFRLTVGAARAQIVAGPWVRALV